MAEQAQVPHHLIDVRKWTENFSVHDFVIEANQLIKEILDQGKVPIIVGRNWLIYSISYRRLSSWRTGKS